MSDSQLAEYVDYKNWNSRLMSDKREVNRTESDRSMPRNGAATYLLSAYWNRTAISDSKKSTKVHAWLAVMLVPRYGRFFFSRFMRVVLEHLSLCLANFWQYYRNRLICSAKKCSYSEAIVCFTCQSFNYRVRITLLDIVVDRNWIIGVNAQLRLLGSQSALGFVWMFACPWTKSIVRFSRNVKTRST